MILEEYKEKYLLSKIKLNNFWNIVNSTLKENNILIKELFNYSDIKENKVKFNNYEVLLYKELISNLLDIVYLDFTILNKILNNKNGNNIIEMYNNIPNDIKDILRLKNSNIEDIIKLYNNMDNYEFDTILFDLEDYCDCLNDLLEMFFETDKWYREREKYLNSGEGKLEYNIYNMQMLINKKYT